MRLIRHGPPGAEHPGILHADDSRADIGAFGEDFDEAFFSSGGPAGLGAGRVRWAEWVEGVLTVPVSRMTAKREHGWRWATVP